MSKVLGVIFSPTDASAIAGFAQKLGLGFDLVQASGAPIVDSGADKVFAAQSDTIPAADAFAAAIGSVAGGYSHVIAVTSMASKDVLPRVAALLNCGMVTDILQAHSANQFERAIVAGTVLTDVEASGATLVLTIRGSAFEAAPSGSPSSIEPLQVPASKVRLVRAAQKSGGRPDLTQAKVVVSGGRPLQNAEQFERVIGGLADMLHGAAGATRAAVDSGIAPNELQVGQTGKVVAPDLYIAAGISGSTQHMAGIKDSKLIVAINKDPEAPIFEMADLGLVADLFETIEKLKAILS